MWEQYYVPKELLANVSLRAPSAPESLKGASQLQDRSSQEASQLQDCSAAVVRVRLKPHCPYASWLEEQYQARALRHFFIVVGEEQYGCEACPSLYAGAPLVFRNYFHEDCAQYGRRVMTVPLALRAPPPPELRHMASWPASQRRFVVNFETQHRNTARDAFLKSLAIGLAATGRRSKLLYPWSRAADTGYGEIADTAYMTDLCNSTFALAPRGNVEETWRLYEALHCGAIPVVTDGRAYFGRFMPRALVELFITVDAKLPDGGGGAAWVQMEALLRDPAALDARQRKLQLAYAAYEKGWREEVGRQVSELAAKG